jgi:hypothetical protein
MHRFLVLVAAVAAMSATAMAQDPTTTLPEAYKVEFENDYVKIVRVRYGAGAKLPTHTHPAGQTAYIYLNDSDGIIFRHTGNRSHVVNRPPVKTGSVRFSTGQGEDHAVENTSAVASDFLRVMIKTENPGGGGRRLQPSDLQYETKQLRISRSKVDSHETHNVTAKEPSLVIELPSGKHHWVDAGQSFAITNHDAQALDLLRFDFLTAPKSPSAELKPRHDRLKSHHYRERPSDEAALSGSE